jgi:hypothetical protein
MKLTKSKLKQIIKEELQKLLLEQAARSKVDPNWETNKENAIKCLIRQEGVWTGDWKTSRVVAERKLSFMHRQAAKGVIADYPECKRELCAYRPTVGCPD